MQDDGLDPDQSLGKHHVGIMGEASHLPADCALVRCGRIEVDVECHS